MSFENVTSYYSLFGSCVPNSQPQGLLMVCPSVQPIPNPMNTIRPPVKPSGHNYRKLFIGNLPPNSTLEEIIELFGRYGPINSSLSVVKDDNYAFIHFFNESDAQRAFKELNNSLFKNRYIRVQYSTSQGHMNKTKQAEPIKKMCQSQSLFSFNNLNNFVHNPLISTSTSSLSLASSSSSSIESCNGMRPIGRAIRGSTQSLSNRELYESNVKPASLPVSQSIDQFLFIQNLIKQQDLLKQQLQLQLELQFE